MTHKGWRVFKPQLNQSINQSIMADKFVSLINYTKMSPVSEWIAVASEIFVQIAVEYKLV